MNPIEIFEILHKQNNWIKKLNPNKKLNGLHGAIRKIWVNEEHFYFLATKHYPAILPLKILSEINYDDLMGKLKEEYIDEFGRVIKVFKIEKDALNYVTN